MGSWRLAWAGAAFATMGSWGLAWTGATFATMGSWGLAWTGAAFATIGSWGLAWTGSAFAAIGSWGLLWAGSAFATMGSWGLAWGGAACWAVWLGRGLPNPLVMQLSKAGESGAVLIAHRRALNPCGLGFWGCCCATSWPMPSDVAISNASIKNCFIKGFSSV